MPINITDTNVVILYGDRAAEHYSEFVNRWSRLIASTEDQWGRFQFFLAASEMPALRLEESAAKHVNNRNTLFYQINAEGSGEEGDAPPDINTYHNIINDKIKSGNVRLHVVVDTADKDFPTEWLQETIHSAMHDEGLTTTCMYYLFLDRNSFAAQKDRLIGLLKAQPGTAFLLGDSNDSGGRVTQEDRLNAAILAVLLNSASLLPVGAHAYSLGYSALNANGLELRRLSESIACRALQNELDKTIDSLSGDINLHLLPSGVSSTAELSDWLKKYVQDNLPQPAAVAMKNACVTIRMNPELSSIEALKRMQRFADLNYTGERNTVSAAKELAWQTESQIRRQLRENVETAALSDGVLHQIANAFKTIASGDVQPTGVTYPRRPIGLFGVAAKIDAWQQQCRSLVAKSIRDYIVRRNVSYFAAEMEKAYRRLADWVRTIRGESDSDYRRITAGEMLRDIQKELDSPEYGNAAHIAAKYRNYAAELEAVRPHLSVLTGNTHAEYFRDSGSLEESSWRELVKTAGKNLERQLSPQYRGDFFRVISTEFSTADEREKFFDEYLKSGQRMFRHLQADQSNGEARLLVDDRLTDKWFSDKTLYDVKTDNAENLTLYPLGDEREIWWYIETEKTVYFQNKEAGAFGKGSTGRNLFTEANRQPVQAKANTVNIPQRGLFDGAAGVVSGTETPAAPKAAKPAGKARVRLEPDEKSNYRLYWDWCGNDENAMVEVFQYGEKVGKVAVIPVKTFKANGNNMNVSDDVMGGKPLPAGTLNVTIRDARQSIYIENAEVTGRRDVVRYKVNNARLQLQPEKSNLVEKVVLRTTDTDGTQVFFPLYPGTGDKPAWLYEGLSLSDGCIVEDPTNPAGLVFPVRVE